MHNAYIVELLLVDSTFFFKKNMENQYRLSFVFSIKKKFNEVMI